MSSSDKDSLPAYSSSSVESPYHFIDEHELNYMSLIQHQIQPFFPRFAAALAEQTPLEREQGRCAAIDFTDPTGHQIFSFNTAADLNSYLRDSSPPPYQTLGNLPRRRLFILEDLPCNHVLALGSQLRIPPSVFAGQWDDPASSTFNHRNPFQRCALPSFRLRYAATHRVEIDVDSHAQSSSGNKNAGSFAFDTRVCRYLHTYARNGLLYDEAKSHPAMSFWSSPLGEDGSWDAVLLVDPPLGKHVRCVTTKALIPLRDRLVDETAMPKHFLHPETTLMGNLPQQSSHWAGAYMPSNPVSMYDDTLKALSTALFEPSTLYDPLRVVEIPRRLVISNLISYVRRRYINVVNIQNSEFRHRALRHDYLCRFSQSNYSSWSAHLFDFIIGSQAAMKEFSREMDDNIVALGLDNPNACAPQWERDGWLSVKELCSLVQQTIDAFATGYLQYVTLEEAHVSNGSAQNVSRITVLTMLFVPLSTVASIFSMGGDFLPGQARAWVFWVVAIPLLAILACLYWYQILVRMWHGKTQEILPYFRKSIEGS
ncbi:hypothetical protein IQ07DRAFT_272736 [Pyrenochaeta sp. DS3sAY3a]|nr:hypothetical protein IQ07DRAFT_272736 [Pyrenochaeta sp. DS3sAY3a]